MKTQGTDNNAATAKATRDSSSRGEVTTDPAAKTLIEAKTFTRAATTTATAAPVDGTMVRAETPISTSRAGVLRREYRFLCAAATRHETDCQSLLSSPPLHFDSGRNAAGLREPRIRKPRRPAPAAAAAPTATAGRRRGTTAHDGSAGAGVQAGLDVPARVRRGVWQQEQLLQVRVPAGGWRG